MRVTNILHSVVVMLAISASGNTAEPTPVPHQVVASALGLAYVSCPVPDSMVGVSYDGVYDLTDYNPRVLNGQLQMIVANQRGTALLTETSNSVATDLRAYRVTWDMSVDHPGCVVSEASQKTVVFTVFDAEGTPIEGASVSLYGLTHQTNRRGEAAVTAWEDGFDRVSVKASSCFTTVLRVHDSSARTVHLACMPPSASDKEMVRYYLHEFQHSAAVSPINAVRRARWDAESAPLSALTRVTRQDVATLAVDILSERMAFETVLSVTVSVDEMRGDALEVINELAKERYGGSGD